MAKYNHISYVKTENRTYAIYKIFLWHKKRIGMSQGVRPLLLIQTHQRVAAIGLKNHIENEDTKFGMLIKEAVRNVVKPSFAIVCTENVLR